MLYELTKDKVPFYSTPQADFKGAGIITKVGNPTVTVIDEEEVVTGTSPVKGNRTKFLLVQGYGWVQDVNLRLLGSNIEEAKDEIDKLEKTYEKVANLMNGVFNKIKDLSVPGLDSYTVGDLVSATLGKDSEGKLDVSTRLFGQPFQFNSETDMRITNASDHYELGRKYTETFIGEAPICSILPGVSTFLPNFSEEDRNSVIEFFNGAGVDGNNKKFLNEILSEESRYFDFVSSYTTYMKYVNLMCRASAIYMGLGNVRVPLANIVNDKLQFFDWKNYKYSGLMVAENQSSKNYTVFDAMKDLKDELTIENLVKETAEVISGVRNYVEFYVDPASSFQETSTNQTAASKISGYLEQGQGMSKEFHFMKGLMDESWLDSFATNTLGSALSAAGGFAETVANAFSGGMIQKLFGASKTVLNGGNVILPDIWGDSSYQKSYSINMNLKSPYGTKESVYLHVLVPLFHLLGLSQPRQITANGFAQPFLVKVSAKGWFSCEMGMIDSISIEKVQGSYTVNGIPTEINVSLSVRDLYSDLMITSSTKPGLFISNRGLMNWLAVTSGVDITEPAFKEKWDGILKMLLVSKLDGLSDTYDTLLEAIQNRIKDINFF